jgi:hypothetical protein
MEKTVINIRNKEAISMLRAIYVAGGRKSQFLHAKKSVFLLTIYSRTVTKIIAYTFE